MLTIPSMLNASLDGVLMVLVRADVLGRASTCETEFVCVIVHVKLVSSVVST